MEMKVFFRAVDGAGETDELHYSPTKFMVTIFDAGMFAKRKQNRFQFKNARLLKKATQACSRR